MRGVRTMQGYVELRRSVATRTRTTKSPCRAVSHTVGVDAARGSLLNLATQLSTESLFQRDAYLKSCAAQCARIQRCRHRAELHGVLSLGGGQPGDSGWLRTGDGRSVRIIDTRKGEQGRIAAYSRGEAAGSRAWAMQLSPQSTGSDAMRTCGCTRPLHLLGSVLRFGVTGGQIASDKSRLDFDTQEEIDRDRVTNAPSTS